MPMTVPYLDKYGLARFWSNVKQQISQTENDAIKKALLSLPGMTDVKIIVNDGEISGNKLRGCETPVGKMEVCYYGGRERDVAITILENKYRTTQTYGRFEQDIEDEDGILHKVYYTRMSESFIRTEISGEKLEGWTDESEALIKARIVELVDALDFGEDVVATNIKTAINTEFAGVFSASSLQVGALSGSAGETVEVLYYRKPMLKAQDITITYEE